MGKVSGNIPALDAELILWPIQDGVGFGFITNRKGVEMNHNKYNFEVGDTVILDSGFHNVCTVKIKAISPNGMFATIHLASENESESWDVMMNRLCPKNPTNRKGDEMKATNLTKQQEPAIRFRELSMMSDNYAHGDPTNNYTDQTNVPAIVAILAGFGLTILCVGVFVAIAYGVSSLIKYLAV